MLIFACSNKIVSEFCFWDSKICRISCRVCCSSLWTGYISCESTASALRQTIKQMFYIFIIHCLCMPWIPPGSYKMYKKRMFLLEHYLLGFYFYTLFPFCSTSKIKCTCRIMFWSSFDIVCGGSSYNATYYCQLDTVTMCVI